MILGITGKIASGKSEVLKILAEKDFFVIDADKVVHNLYKKNGVGSKIVSDVFGDKYLNTSDSFILVYDLYVQP